MPSDFKTNTSYWLEEKLHNIPFEAKELRGNILFIMLFIAIVVFIVSAIKLGFGSF